MLLGLGGTNSDHDIDPAELRAGAGVPNGELLVRFVDASFESADAVAAVRDECIEKLGFEATVDAVAVIANFHMMTRIADSTGTPLDEGTKNVSGDLRAELGLDEFKTRRFDLTV